jgi:hypothetical protein
LLYLAIAQLLLILAIVIAWVVRGRDHERALLELEAGHRAERAELLERIQRPERVPVSQRPRPPRRTGDDPRDLPGDAQRMAQVGTFVPTRDPDPS